MRGPLPVALRAGCTLANVTEPVGLAATLTGDARSGGRRVQRWTSGLLVGFCSRGSC